MGMRKQIQPTLKDVAIKAGTSIATASNVISGKKGKFVSEKLRCKVLNAASELGYLPNMVARSMKGKSRRIIAMLVPELYNSVYMRMVMGAERVATERGYLMLICSTLEEPSREEGYIQSLIAQQVDGFLLAVSLKGATNAELLERLGMPFVVLDRPFVSSFPYESVTFDEKQAVRKAFMHLYDKGHRSICYIGPVGSLVVERRNAFKDVVREMNLDEKKCPVHLLFMNDDESERLLKECMSERSCTALIIGHHMIAEHMVKQMRKHNIKVPEDFSVIIIGNPIWTELSGPGFTAVELPHPEVGRLASQRLIDRIEGSKEKKKSIVIECELIERSSVKDLTGVLSPSE